MLKTEKIVYEDQGVTLEGYVAYQDQAQKKPLILVAHDWSGRNEFAMKQAEKLASLGFVGFAIDMYGNAHIGQTKEEKTALIQPFMQNRKALMQRMQAALTKAQSLPYVDAKKVAAIGFCFGGLCVLDLARSGADIAGVVSFHGLLHAPEQVAVKKIHAKILALHGYDDPMVKPDQVIAFANEMSEVKADWELNMYGNTMHGFTNPQANDPDFGTVFNATVAKRAYQAMQNFFEEILSF